MVDLVLQRAGEEAVSGHADGSTPAIERGHDGMVGAGRLGIEPVHREAALEVGLLAVDADHDRVHELDMATLDLDHRDALRPPDLVRRKADAGGVAHRLRHVVEEVAQGPVEARDEDRRDAQDRVAQLDDGEDRHVRSGGIRPSGVGGPAGRAPSDEAQVRQLDLEAARRLEPIDGRDDRRIGRRELPFATAPPAVEVPVFLGRAGRGTPRAHRRHGCDSGRRSPRGHRACDRRSTASSPDRARDSGRRARRPSRGHRFATGPRPGRDVAASSADRGHGAAPGCRSRPWS